MKNIYIIYISSLETGDTMLIRSYPSFNIASKDINDVLDWYIKTNCIGYATRNINNKDFNEEHLKYDTTFKNGYIFRIKKNSIYIYLKKTDVGWITTGISFKRVGKIGIEELDVSMSDKESSSEIPIKQTSNNTSNLEHGQHVSLMEELKNVICKNRNNVNIDVERPPIMNILKDKFISDLRDMKTKLKHI